jgi:hypothetical protein
MVTIEPVAWVDPNKELPTHDCLVAVINKRGELYKAQYDSGNKAFAVRNGWFEIDEIKGWIPLSHSSKETIPNAYGFTAPLKNVTTVSYPVTEHFEDEPQAEELHEILQSNNHPVKELTDEEIIAQRLNSVIKQKEAEIEALKTDKALHDEAYLSQMKEIEALKAENKFFRDLMSDTEILRKAQK